ncbi:MAG: acyl carrier protein [Magnetococcales bacterium]|nr:acyl carrier protein [Magnetococcales bacterium]
MSIESLLHRLQPMFRQAFGDDTLKLTETTRMEDIPSWDSISHMALITATEQEFDIRFSLAELVSVAEVGDLIALIQAKKGG